MSALPFGQERGLRRKHELNKRRVNNHQNKEQDVIKLLREIYVIIGDVLGNTKCNVPENQQDRITEIKQLCDNLGISKNILSKIINDYSDFDKNNTKTIKTILTKPKKKKI